MMHFKLLLDCIILTMTSLQLDQVQLQLRQKSRLLEQMSAAEAQHAAELAALNESLKQCNQGWALTEKELRSARLEAKQAQGEASRLTSTLEQQYVERSTMFRQPDDDTDHGTDLSHAESKTVLLTNEIDNLQLQIQVMFGFVCTHVVQLC